jgi:hypothetical protein
MVMVYMIKSIRMITMSKSNSKSYKRVKCDMIKRRVPYPNRYVSELNTFKMFGDNNRVLTRYIFAIKICKFHEMKEMK